MTTKPDEILSILDQCCEMSTFPMLDNGYVYLAATRMSLFRSSGDWAMVIEVFGFSPRSRLPDTVIYTFASRLCDRDKPDQFVSQDAYNMYLARNPNNEFRAVFPIGEGHWQDPEDAEVLADGATEIPVRHKMVALPSRTEYSRYGIELDDPEDIFVYEACRFVAATHRSEVLATDIERRQSVPPELDEVLVLDEWAHPDIADDSQRPSTSPTFQQLASVLVDGDSGLYAPSLPANTHWSHWPDGGTL